MLKLARDWSCNGADLANRDDVGHLVARFPPYTYACVLRFLRAVEVLLSLLGSSQRMTLAADAVEAAS